MLPSDLAVTIALAGVDPMLADQAMEAALRGAIADRRGHVAWDVDAVAWQVELMRPERESFSGQTLAAALAWCLVRLIHNELSAGSLTS